ncbi:TolB family protein, partial [Dokdonella sp.]|uniref:TolB family protein n=1 Tax=Dokdonella sp. TaxID=2291710 RepID=UPI003C684EEB
MFRFAAATLFVWLCVLCMPASAITLEQSMADPDWIGPPVESPYWSVDGKSIYYQLKRNGSTVRDLHRVDLATGEDVIIDPALMAGADGANAVFDRSRQQAAFIRSGDVFIRDVRNDRLIQVTRTPQAEASPQFSADARSLQFRSGNDWFVYDIASRVVAPAA